MTKDELLTDLVLLGFVDVTDKFTLDDGKFRYRHKDKPHISAIGNQHVDIRSGNRYIGSYFFDRGLKLLVTVLEGHFDKG